MEKIAFSISGILLDISRWTTSTNSGETKADDGVGGTRRMEVGVDWRSDKEGVRFVGDRVPET